MNATGRICCAIRPAYVVLPKENTKDTNRAVRTAGSRGSYAAGYRVNEGGKSRMIANNRKGKKRCPLSHCAWRSARDQRCLWPGEWCPRRQERLQALWKQALSWKADRPVPTRKGKQPCRPVKDYTAWHWTMREEGANGRKPVDGLLPGEKNGGKQQGFPPSADTIVPVRSTEYASSSGAAMAGSGGMSDRRGAGPAASGDSTRPLY